MIRTFVGAIFVLAGSILIAAGMIADAVDTRAQIFGTVGYAGIVGYVLGGAMAIVGILNLMTRRGWDDDDD